MAIQATPTITSIPPAASPAAVPHPQTSEIVEAVLTKGDLAQLTTAERTTYYTAVCKSVGLNPLTTPLAYITLNGKLTLYALRNATDQLRAIHGVSVQELTETERDGVYIVTAKVRDRDGRTDIAKGAVSIQGLKGDALANSFMKAESKAKRRATLSLCGLGFLDESELDTVPAVRRQPPPVPVKEVTPVPVAPAATDPSPSAQEPHDPETGEIGPRTIALPEAKAGWNGFIWWGSAFIASVTAAGATAEIDDWQAANEATLATIKAEAPKIYDRITANIAAARDKLANAAGGIPPFLDRRKKPNGGES